MSKTTIRYGMVGGGEGAFIGAVHRIAARLDKHFELVCGAFSSDATRSKDSGQALGLMSERCYANFNEMFTTEAVLPATQRMQCVVIVTPNHLHFPVAAAAIKQDFHVISDKPATLNLAECRELANLLKDSDCHYVLTHPYTAYPMVREARNRVAAGELGAIRKIIVEYTQGWLSEALEQEGHPQASWRTDPQKAGASCCMGDIGVHAFNLAEYVSGEKVQRLNASLNKIVPGRKLDDDGVVMLDFGRGVSGHLFASQVCVGEENNLRLRIYGDKAGLEWQQEEPNSLWLKYADKPKTLIRTAGPGVDPELQTLTRLPAGHPEGYLEAFGNIYSTAAELISTEQSKPAGHYSGIHAALRGMAFIETAVNSDAQGNVWLDMPDFGEES